MMAKNGEAREPIMPPNGVFRRISTVWSSTTTTSSMQLVISKAQPAAMVRSSEYLISSTVILLPSWKETSFVKVTVYVRPSSLITTSSARYGL